MGICHSVPRIKIKRENTKKDTMNAKKKLRVGCCRMREVSKRDRQLRALNGRSRVRNTRLKSLDSEGNKINKNEKRGREILYKSNISGISAVKLMGRNGTTML